MFNAQDCQRFFEEAGLELKVERGARVFPASDSADDVVATFLKLLKQADVDILYNKRVRSLLLDEGTDVAKSVRGLRFDQGTLDADAVVLATGGASYPLTGSTGDGYALATSAGHSIVPPRGALVPLETSDLWPLQLQGLSLRNVRLSLYRGDKHIGEEFGEMLFTHFGISGPIVLSLSRLLLDASEGEYRFVLNLKPALSPEQIDARLQRDFHKYSRRQLLNGLDDLLPQKLIPVFVLLSGIPADKPVHSVTRAERLHLADMFRALTMHISSPRPLSEAIVTAGGVAIREIDSKTMASKLCQGLYLAGEVIDFDGYTGGFNLQAAFSSGFVAGKSAGAHALPVQ